MITHLADLCTKSLFEGREVELGYICVCYEDIYRCRKCGEHCMCNVWDQVKTAVDGLSSKNGHFQDVRNSVHNVFFCLRSRGKRKRRGMSRFEGGIL